MFNSSRMLSLVIILMIAGNALAQTGQSTDELIKKMQQRLDQLQSAEESRSRSLDLLTRQIEEASRDFEAGAVESQKLRDERDLFLQNMEEQDDEKSQMAEELEGKDAVIRSQQEEVASLRNRLLELENELSSFQKTVAEKEVLLGEGEAEKEQLRERLAQNEQSIARQDAQIESLNAELAEALAEKVEELSQYRSEFFGRLRQLLGNRSDIRIVGDRFVFQSEVLFASGSASLGAAGRRQLLELSRALREVAQRIPEEIDWVLRVDGHTDRVPVGRGSAFSSNWELSTARAISVIEYLIAQGIPPRRLAAAGFGQYQPLDPGNSENAFRRNRRIEFKLTEG